MNITQHLQNLITDTIATLIHKTQKTCNCQQTIEELAQEIQQWANLHTRTQQQLRLQQHATQRLYKTLAKHADNPHINHTLEIHHATTPPKTTKP